jgi:hypothetical protein
MDAPTSLFPIGPERWRDAVGFRVSPPRRNTLRRRPFGCATRSTANSSPRNPASSSAERPRKPNTFVSPYRVRLAGRSATNTRSPSAGFTTAICTATVMKPHGGPGLASTLCPSCSSYDAGRYCRAHRKRLCPSQCPMSSRLRRRRPSGRHWTTTPGTGSSKRKRALEGESPALRDHFP